MSQKGAKGDAANIVNALKVFEENEAEEATKKKFKLKKFEILKKNQKKSKFFFVQFFEIAP